MPPLFPRPSPSTQLSKLDVLPTCSATDALMMPSFPPSIYSPSLPLFGHRYFSALNHAAAASLLPHQSTINPFLRNGTGTLAQQLENDASSSSSIPQSDHQSIFVWDSSNTREHFQSWFHKRYQKCVSCENLTQQNTSKIWFINFFHLCVFSYLFIRKGLRKWMLKNFINFFCVFM